MGARVSLSKLGSQENMAIKGRQYLLGNALSSFGDHRTAMSMVVAGLAAEGATSIDDLSCIKKSFPEFLNLIKTIVR